MMLLFKELNYKAFAHFVEWCLENYGDAKQAEFYESIMRAFFEKGLNISVTIIIINKIKIVNTYKFMIIMHNYALKYLDVGVLNLPKIYWK